MDECTACTPVPLDPRGFNKQAILPCGLSAAHVKQAMADFLDFLGLTGAYLEKDVQQAILRELEAFILELGSDFAFFARQKRIFVDNFGMRNSEFGMNMN